MSDTADAYAARFPDEIRRAIEGLDGANRQAVVVALTNEGRLAFSELRDELDLHQQSLSNALDALVRGGLVRQRASGDDSPYPAYYEVSGFGQRFVESTFRSLGHAELPEQEVGPGSHCETYVEAENVLGRDHPALIELPDVSGPDEPSTGDGRVENASNRR